MLGYNSVTVNSNSISLLNIQFLLCGIQTTNRSFGVFRVQAITHGICVCRRVHK